MTLFPLFLHRYCASFADPFRERTGFLESVSVDDYFLLLLPFGGREDFMTENKDEKK